MPPRKPAAAQVVANEPDMEEPIDPEANNDAATVDMDEMPEIKFNEEQRLFLYSYLAEYRAGVMKTRKALMTKKVLPKYLARYCPSIRGVSRLWMKKVRVPT
jgi:hypothetical protein